MLLIWHDFSKSPLLKLLWGNATIWIKACSHFQALCIVLKTAQVLVIPRHWVFVFSFFPHVLLLVFFLNYVQLSCLQNSVFHFVCRTTHQPAHNVNVTLTLAQWQTALEFCNFDRLWLPLQPLSCSYCACLHVLMWDDTLFMCLWVCDKNLFLHQ